MAISEKTVSPLLEARHEIPPTIVFANNGYREIVENWIRFAYRANVSNFWLIALDQELHKHLIKKNIQTILLEADNKLEVLWKIRIQLFRKLIDNGIDFIHSDADAVWLRNPIQRYYIEQEGIDLIVSQGTIWSLDIFKQWNFVLCCGFFVMRANQRTVNFMHELEADVEITGDDQISLNRLVFKHNMNWKIKSSYCLPFRGAQLLLSHEMILGKGDSITIGIIPFSDIPRLQVDYKQSYVAHPLTPKNNIDKKLVFQRLGLWI